MSRFNFTIEWVSLHLDKSVSWDSRKPHMAERVVVGGQEREIVTMCKCRADESLFVQEKTFRNP